MTESIVLAPVREQIVSAFTPQILDFERLEATERECFALNLRRCRIQLKLSQLAMAQKMSVCLRQYQRYEEGSYPCMKTMATFMLATGVPYQYLFVGGCYQNLFKDIPRRKEAVVLQSLAGLCSDSDFHSLVLLISGTLERTRSIQPEELCFGSSIELLETPSQQGYYAMVAGRLRELRNLLDLTTDDMAELLGVESRTWRAYEHENDGPQFSVLMALRLWAATKINPLWLTYGTDFFKVRLIQHRRMEYLLGLFNELPEAFDSTVKQMMSVLHKKYMGHWGPLN
ncbi:hypothetical protein NFC81_14845 [Salinispirillum sp. LH 10-3-1]|uniref:HTH cro/C1-type domain-containing protein n=1 Tax=Salinispirillum sp. LH 10-3-1 TaxID=2952525 RepID=A0AB38YFM0_9GAMM